jgi:RNA polymerase sigma-70 factor (ECF subfamily)
MSAEEDRIVQLREGGQQALARLFMEYRDRLHGMVQTRLDRRLCSRVDASDVLQETFFDASNRLSDYLDHPNISFFSWLRFLVHQRLAAVHRWHFRRRKRDPRQEQAFPTLERPNPGSRWSIRVLQAADTSPSGVAVRSELAQVLRELLDCLDPKDREILILRHFDELTNNEAAAKLGLTKAAASKRYIRAIKRLKEAALPELESEGWS